MRWLVQFVGAIALSVSFALLGMRPAAARTPAAAPAPRTFLVQAGAASSDQAIQLPMFFPSASTVNVGDSITWADGSALEHTVSFGDPPATWGPNVAPFGTTAYDGTGFLNSGTIWAASAPVAAGPKSFTLTFTRAGTFTYRCRFHVPAMTGTVVVQPAGSPYPAGQDTYQAASDPRIAPALRAGAARLAARAVTTTANGDGTTTYRLDAGSGDGKSYSLMRFGADRLTIRAGDTVVWTNNEPADAHTVTFLDNGQDVPFERPGHQVNPLARDRAGGGVYPGSGYFNSGILRPAPAALAARTYTLAFPEPGTYSYQCLIHDELGMKGTIHVLAAAAGLPRAGGAPFTVGLVMAGLGVALIGGGGVHRRVRYFAGIQGNSGHEEVPDRHVCERQR